MTTYSNFIFVSTEFLLSRNNYTENVRKIAIQNRGQFLRKHDIRLAWEHKNGYSENRETDLLGRVIASNGNRFE